MPGRHDVGSCPTAATDDVSFGYLKSSFAWLQHLHLAVCLKQLGFRGRMFRIDERFKTQEKQMETELTSEATPPADQIMQFFKYEHLRPDLQAVSKPFCLLAEEVVMNLPQNAERTVCLRKLLEAKDAAVRAAFCVDR